MPFSGPGWFGGLSGGACREVTFEDIDSDSETEEDGNGSHEEASEEHAETQTVVHGLSTP
jgi:hypothetical protein